MPCKQNDVSYLNLYNISFGPLDACLLSDLTGRMCRGSYKLLVITKLVKERLLSFCVYRLLELWPTQSNFFSISNHSMCLKYALNSFQSSTKAYTYFTFIFKIFSFVRFFKFVKDALD